MIKSKRLEILAQVLVLSSHSTLTGLKKYFVLKPPISSVAIFRPLPDSSPPGLEQRNFHPTFSLRL